MWLYKLPQSTSACNAALKKSVPACEKDEKEDYAEDSRVHHQQNKEAGFEEEFVKSVGDFASGGPDVDAMSALIERGVRLSPQSCESHHPTFGRKVFEGA